MSLLPLFCLSGFLINLASSSSTECTIVTYPRSIFKRGKRLHGFQFNRSTSVPNAFHCARMCFFRRRCLSFNYNKERSLCEFNKARVDPPNVTLNASRGYLYSDMADWDKVIGMGPCQNRPCGICEACYPTASNYTCVKEELTSCSDAKMCSKSNSDGHYLIRPSMRSNSLLKVYCHEITSNSPREYITLIHDNFSKYPPNPDHTCSSFNWDNYQPGVIFYHKIRLDIATLRVIRDDRTFTNISCDPSLLGISDQRSFQKSGRSCSVMLNYGETNDCHRPQCDDRKGNLIINLTGTGLIVSPSVTWISSGVNSNISSFRRSPSNEVIKVVCGGTCGMCFPKGDLILELK